MYDAVLAAAHALHATPAAIAAPYSIGAGEPCLLNGGATLKPWAHGKALRDALATVSFVGVTSAPELLQLSSTFERDTMNYAIRNMQSLRLDDGAFVQVASGRCSDSSSSATGQAHKRGLQLLVLCVVWPAAGECQSKRQWCDYPDHRRRSMVAGWGFFGQSGTIRPLDGVVPPCPRDHDSGSTSVPVSCNRP